MNKEIRTITERDKFDNILNQFHSSKVFVKSKSGNIEVTYLGQREGHTALHFPMNITPSNCSIFTRSGDDILISYLSFHEKKNEEVFLFDPYKIQIVTSPRYDRRKALSFDSKDIIFATNIISDSLIKESLDKKNILVRKIKEAIQNNKKNDFEYLKIFFSNEEVNDPRLKFFHDYRIPIVLSDYMKKEISQSERLLKLYLDNIYSKDNALQNMKNLRSEISIPITYNNKIPYGYIQANSSMPMAKSSLQSLKSTAVFAENKIKESKIFSEYTHKFLVSDISARGLGIVFKEKDYLPIYKTGNHVSLDMSLPQRKKASILADVRHVDILSNNIIKVGFYIKNMDDRSSENYNKFLRIVEN